MNPDITVSNPVQPYKYHCQHQAESFAHAIIAVPENYPLLPGLPTNYPQNLSKLCALAKDIYLDMAKQPEAYGLMLIDINSQDHNLARDGYRTLHRLCDLLVNLSQCSELNDHRLTVNKDKFTAANKKGTGLVSGPVPKYELFFSRLVDFGFTISDFDGKPFNKKVTSFTIEYPDFPEMTDTIKFYCDCWKQYQKKDVKLWSHEFHHHFYRFDYKITADRAAIPLMQWVMDEAVYLGYTPELKAFSLAFYEHSLQYSDVCFDGDYTYKGKRIARIYQSGYIALGKTKYHMHVRLKNMDKYSSQVERLPESLREKMGKDNCRHCNFQGATEDYCKFRIHWTLNGQKHVGCAHVCFYFNDFTLERIPDYWRLLELEYGLKKTS